MLAITQKLFDDKVYEVTVVVRVAAPNAEAARGFAMSCLMHHGHNVVDAQVTRDPDADETGMEMGRF